jgi:mitochondrial fission protein ELM1
MKNTKQKKILIWRLIDGKTGHEKQTLSLVNALKDEIAIKTIDIKIQSFLLLILFSMKVLKKIQNPDLIIAAGHKTHISLLFLKYFYGGKSILLMKPSLPCNWFDLCIIPEHDKFKVKGLIVWTKGVLVNTTNLINKNEKKGLILIGGISKHYIWDSESVVNQIKKLLNNNLLIDFILSTSRRTPKDFMMKINKISFKNLKIYHIKKQNKNWLTNQMNKTKYAWITEDSMSMIYESITAGQNVGLISLKSKGKSRITEEVNRLKEEKIVFVNENKSYKNRNKPHAVINEANRCAKFINKIFIKKV